MEECVSAGNPCGDGSIWPNLDTFCKQMYADIKLWAMTGTGEEVIHNWHACRNVLENSHAFFRTNL